MMISIREVANIFRYRIAIPEKYRPWKKLRLMFTNLFANHAEKNSAQKLNLNRSSSHQNRDERISVSQQARFPEKGHGETGTQRFPGTQFFAKEASVPKQKPLHIKSSQGADPSPQSPNRHPILRRKVHVVSLRDPVEVEEFVVLLQCAVGPQIVHGMRIVDADISVL